jgi:hypothetical protein
MTTRTLPRRLGAASGALCTVVILAGSGHSSPGDVTRELIGVTLFLPFLAYICNCFREVEGEAGWLSVTALTAGISGTTIKLLTGVPVIALNNVNPGTPLHKTIDDMASASTTISLYPLAVMLTALAALTFRTRVLPHWLGYGAAIAALAMVVNAVYGTFQNVNSGPALVLWLFWTLAASIVLFRRAGIEPKTIARAYSPATS